MLALLQKKTGQHNKKTSFKAVILIIKNVLIEFGYPAFLDLLLVRPFFMYWLPILTGNALTGIMAGKICADVVFYFLTIMNYGVMKRKNYF
jgi:hypothetical protein